MKSEKFWTIKNGEVVAVSPLMRGMNSLEICAPTKSAALAILLDKLERQSKALAPRLWVKNGAYCLAYWNTNACNYTVDGGTLHARRANLDGSVFPLVSGQAENIGDARKVASFDYYSSETFQSEQAKAYGGESFASC